MTAIKWFPQRKPLTERPARSDPVAAAKATRRRARRAARAARRNKENVTVTPKRQQGQMPRRFRPR